LEFRRKEEGCGEVAPVDESFDVALVVGLGDFGRVDVGSGSTEGDVGGTRTETRGVLDRTAVRNEDCRRHRPCMGQLKEDAAAHPNLWVRYLGLSIGRIPKLCMRIFTAC